jgi:protein-tyrosine phosphatase
VEVCPVPDYGIPEDGGKFLGSVRRTADFIRSGRIVLVHCGAGKGRTGMFAVCTLIRLGMPPEVAHRIVSQADSGPETEEQCDFIRSVTPRLQAI